MVDFLSGIAYHSIHNVAGVAKWLRPRIVVPVFVGSSPIIRPIFTLLSLFLGAATFFKV